MNTAKDIRSDILEILIKVEDVKTLESIRYELEKIYQKSIGRAEDKRIPAFMKGVKPIRENVTLEQIKAEQNYKPVTYKEFREVADQMEWEESLEELLEAIK